MKNWKKGCAGILAAALTVSAVLPGTGVAVKADGEAEAAASVLLPKYEMKFDGSLEVTGTGGEDGVSVFPAVRNIESQYSGDLIYTEGIDGQAISMNNAYGIVLDNVKLQDSYTISAWINPQQQILQHSALIAIGAQNNRDDWLSFAGNTDSGQAYELWEDLRQIWAEMLPYNLNEWKQYTLVVDKGEASFYENGDLIRSGNASGVDFSNNVRIMLGVNYWDPLSDVYMDEVKIYNHAFSAEQASALYSGEKVLSIAGAQKRSLGIGRAVTLNAEVLNGDGTETTSWYSQNPEVASVDASGIVSGKSEGTTTITVSAEIDGEIKTASVTVTVGKMIADFNFDDEESGFTSSGAKAEKYGEISIVERGDETGKALSLDGVDDWLNVTKEDGSSLLSGLEEFTVSLDSYSQKEDASWSFYAAPNAGQQEYLKETYIALVYNIQGLSFEYYKEGRNNTDTGSVSISGSYAEGWKHVDAVVSQDTVSLYINKVKVAESSIKTAISDILGENSILQIGKGNWGSGEYFQGQIDNYKIYNYAMTEEEITNIPVSEVTINGGTEVTVGDTMQLEAVVTPENATIKGVEWSSDNTGIAEVDQNGLVRGVSVGEATITAKAKDGGVIATQDIAVNPILVSSIEINGGSEVQIGGNLQLSATVSPANAANQSIEWSSEDSEIATVDENTGLVTGVSEGSVQIIAKALDGSDVSSSVTITVSKVPVTEVSIEGESERTMEIGDRITLAANVAPENATYKGIEWSSNNASVATVDQSGNVIAMASGEAVITAKSSDNPEITAQITVTVQEKKYTVMVTNGTIKDGKTEYAYKEQATVTAEQETAEGTFTHWEDEKGNILSHASTYTFFVTRDITLTACYSQEEAEEKATISCSASYDYAKGKFVFIAERSIPASLCADSTVVEHGIIVTTNEAIANDSDFQIGKSGVSKATAKTANGLLGTYILNVSSKSSNICYGRGYVTYRSAETNENVTLYSDIVLCQK